MDEPMVYVRIYEDPEQELPIVDTRNSYQVVASAEQPGNLSTETQQAAALISSEALVQKEEYQHSESSTNERKARKSRRPIGRQPQTCSTCGKIYDCRSKLQSHIEAEHEGKRHTCHICGVTTKWKQNLTFHLLKLHNIGEGNLKELQKLNPKNHTCQTCGKTYRNKCHLEEHVATEHEGKRFTCHICGVAVKWKSNLKVHLLKLHKVGDEPLKKEKKRECDMCSLTFQTNALLLKHLTSVHHIEKPFKCPLCPETFKRDVILRKHKLEHPEFVRFRCSVCNCRFQMLSYFEKHCKQFGHEQVAEHGKDIDDFFCYKCTKLFVGYSSFELHIHEANTMGCSVGDEDPQCNQCNVKFTFQKELREHYRSTHGLNRKGTKNYRKKKSKQVKKKPSKEKCKICGKMVSSDSGTMKYHLHWHEGRKDFKCDICGHEMTFPSHFRQHMQKHFEKKRLKCDVCPAGFNSERDLYVHAYTHKDTPPPQCRGCGKKRYTDLLYGQHLKSCKEWKELPNSCEKDKEEEFVRKFREHLRAENRKKLKRKREEKFNFEDMTKESIVCDIPTEGLQSESDGDSLGKHSDTKRSKKSKTGSTKEVNESAVSTYENEDSSYLNDEDEGYRMSVLQLSLQNFSSLESRVAERVRNCMQKAFRNEKPPATCAGKNGLVINTKVANQIRRCTRYSGGVKIEVKNSSEQTIQMLELDPNEVPDKEERQVPDKEEHGKKRKKKKKRGSWMKEAMAKCTVTTTSNHNKQSSEKKRKKTTVEQSSVNQMLGEVESKEITQTESKNMKTKISDSQSLSIPNSCAIDDLIDCEEEDEDDLKDDDFFDDIKFQ